jgi:uncharacterized protein YecT (DUF1311 family)
MQSRFWLFSSTVSVALLSFALCSINLILVSTTTALAQPVTSKLLTQTQQPICKNPQTQLDLNQCTDLRAKAVDKRLNQVYQQVRAKYKGSENENLLINAQLDWIKYRDSACSFSSSRFKGGSIAPLVYSNCIGRMAGQRTDELETYLKEGEF